MKKLLLALWMFACLGNVWAKEEKSVEEWKAELTQLTGQAKLTALQQVCTQLIAADQLNEANVFAQQAMEVAIQLGDQKAMAVNHDNLGYIFEGKYDYTNAMKSFVAGLKIRNDLGDQVGIATSKNNIGKIFYLQEDITSAVENLSTALEIRMREKDLAGAAETHKNLADVYLLKKLYGKSKEHYRNAMDMLIQLDDLEGAAHIASFLGQISSDLGDYEGALAYYHMSLDLDNSTQNLPRIASDYNNIAMAHMAQGSLEEALDANDMAYKIRRQVEDKLGLAETNKNFGIILAKMEQLDNANTYLEASIKLLLEIGVEPGTPFIYQAISETYRDMGNFSKAYETHVAYATSRDELYNKEKSTALLELTTKYESEFAAEQQEQIIASLEKEQAFSQKIRYFLLAMVGVGLLLIVVLYTSYKSKQRDNELLTDKNEEINRQKAEIDQQNEALEKTNASLDELNQKLVTEMAERESIEQSSFARDRFLATMSHEMRTPMNIIIGLTHLLLEENPRPDQVEHLRTLQFSANNLIVFINDVLDFSKIEAGKINLESRVFDPVRTFEETRERFQLPARDKKLTLNYRYDKKLPTRLMGDPTRLNQILTNLVSNSIKYTDSGTVDVEVRLHELSAKEATILMTVTVTGQGIAKEKLEEMFRKFTKTSEDIFEGYASTGLGLAITKRLVDLQNGKIEVESEAGRGTTFTVFLPYKIATDEQVEMANIQQQKEPNFEDLSGHKILVVEDNRINQLVVAKMLRKIGMEVVTADNGAEALEAFNNSYFDLVLMDIQMPVMDGYRATAEIRKSTDPRKRDVPIIALTASAFLTEKEKAKLFGMNDHVGKPFGPDDLLDKINSCLEMYKKV